MAFAATQTLYASSCGAKQMTYSIWMLDCNWTWMVFIVPLQWKSSAIFFFGLLYVFIKNSIQICKLPPSVDKAQKCFCKTLVALTMHWQLHFGSFKFGTTWQWKIVHLLLHNQKHSKAMWSARMSFSGCTCRHQHWPRSIMRARCTSPPQCPWNGGPMHPWPRDF